MVEGRTREAEGSGARCDGDAVNPDAPEHLVLDLHDVARVEEVLPREGVVGDALGARVEAATRAEGVGLRVGRLAAGHGEKLRG